MSSPKMNYNALLEAIGQAHQQAQAGAAGAVNRHLILRNWIIGAYLVEFEQNGKDRAQYGAGLLKKLSADLRMRDVNGCSVQMLERMRLFYALYPQIASEISSPPVRILGNTLTASGSENSSSVMRKSEKAIKKAPRPLPIRMLLRLSWTHFIEILALDDPWKRAFYENECLKGNWSVRQLQRQMGSLLYERTGLSTDKQAVIQAGREQAHDAPQAIADLIRDPYVLEFAGLAELPKYRESTLEAALLNHLQSFLLELGGGFCFEARQKRVTVGNEHDYLDLVFYHRVLRCHLLIDLKVRAFQHGDAGQMNFYLNFWKDRMMGEGDNPPVGLLLCTDKDQTKVEYAAGGLDRQLFVSRYLVALPKPEQLQELVENDRAQWEQQQALSESSQSNTEPPS
jgi:predicted nuclease of restriction endonuclease-like (RecB) superfamily